MTEDEQEKAGQAAEDANEAASDSTDHPETSSYGTLDVETLREHADDVDDAIQEAKRRSG